MAQRGRRLVSTGVGERHWRLAAKCRVWHRFVEIGCPCPDHDPRLGMYLVGFIVRPFVGPTLIPSGGKILWQVIQVDLGGIMTIGVGGRSESRSPATGAFLPVCSHSTQSTVPGT